MYPTLLKNDSITLTLANTNKCIPRVLKALDIFLLKAVLTIAGKISHCA
jgi:hypothetical protein